MSDVQHTPGPWFVGKNGGGEVVSDCIDYYGGHLIAESIAPCNLPLIAAAPDLLAACRALHQAVDLLLAQRFVEHDEFPSRSRVWPALVAGHAAILKATEGAAP